MLQYKKSFTLTLCMLIIAFSFAQNDLRPTPTLQKGHTAPVSDVKISNDGEFIFSASLDGSVKMWSAISKKEIRTFEKHSPNTTAAKLLLTDDGQTLISGSGEGFLKKWNINTGEQLDDFEQQETGITALAWVGDAPLLAVALDNGKINIIEPNSHTLIQTIEGHKGTINDLQVSPTGEYFVTAGEDKQVKVWASLYFTEIFNFKKHGGAVNKIAFINDNLFASAGEDGKVFFYDRQLKQSVKSIQVSQSPILHFNYDKAQDKILVKSTLGNWTIKGNNFSHSKWKHNLPQRAMLYQSITPTLVLGVENNQLFYHHIRRGTVEYFTSPDIDFSFPQNINNVALDRSGAVMATSSNQYVRIWGAETGKFIKTSGAVSVMALSKDGSKIALCTNTNDIILYERASGKILFTLKGHSGIVRTLAFAINDDILFSGSEDNSVKLWKVTTGENIGSLQGHDATITALTILEDNNRIASGDAKGIVKVWNFKTKIELQSQQAHSGGIYALAVTDDSKTLATGSDNGTIKLWRMDDFGLNTEFKAHKSIIRTLDFNLQGDYLVSCGDDVIKLWNRNNGQLLHQLRGHQSPVTTAQFSPNGNFIISSGYDNTLRYWDTYSWKEAVTTYILGQKDWAVVSKSGLFDGSIYGMEAIHFVVKNDAIELSQLKERYFEPQLINKVLANENVSSLRNVEDLKYVSIYPKVNLHLDTTNNKPTLFVKLTNQGGGIGRVAVFVNNKEVVEDMRAGQFLRDPEMATFIFDIQRYLAFFKPNEPNEIAIKAYNMEGWLSSPSYQVEYMPDISQYTFASRGENNATQKIDLNRLYIPNFYGIIIGTSDYRGEKLDLTFAAKDANDMAAAMNDIAVNLFGEDNVHIKLLTTDEVGENFQPTKKNIAAAFEQFALESTTNDVFFVYLSGHGTNNEVNQKEQFYYLTKDLASGDIQDFDIRENYTVSTDEFTEWMKKIPAAKQVMVIDACASGAIADKLYGANKAALSSSDRRAFERMKDRTGVFVLAGSAADQSSYEASQFGQGLLTYSILLGLNGAALRDGGYVDVMQLFQFAADKVPEFAQYIGGVQRPVITTPKGGNSFDIGKVTEQTAIPLAQVKPLFVRSNFQNELSYDDDLLLADKLNQRLLDIANDSRTSTILFTDISHHANAYSIKGRYTLDNDKLLIEGRLFKGREMVIPFKVEGNKNDMDTTVEMIIEAIQRGL